MMGSQLTLRRTALLFLMAQVQINCSGEDDVKGAATAGDFGGTWTRGKGGTCETAENKESSKKASLKIVDGFGYSQIVEFYSDGDCKTLTITATQSGNLSLLGTAPKDSKATMIKQTANKFEIAWNTEAGVTDAIEGDGYCGIKEWKIDVVQDVTNKTCKNKNGDNISFAYKNRTSGQQNGDRNIIKFSDDKKALIFGNDETRVNELDPEDKCKLIDDGKTADSCFPTKANVDENLNYFKVE
jgi:hypothetical protein